MITDDQTNKVYFSEYLRAYKCWKSIKEALLEHEINFEMLPGTKDIWVRDFMPIQKDVKSFIGYEYNPDYLKTRVRDNILKSKEQKTIQPTKGGHKMVTYQNYVSLFYCQITSCPSDGGIS